MSASLLHPTGKPAVTSTNRTGALRLEQATDCSDAEARSSLSVKDGTKRSRRFPRLSSLTLGAYKRHPLGNHNDDGCASPRSQRSHRACLRPCPRGTVWPSHGWLPSDQQTSWPRQAELLISTFACSARRNVCRQPQSRSGAAPGLSELFHTRYMTDVEHDVWRGFPSRSSWACNLHGRRLPPQPGDESLLLYPRYYLSPPLLLLPPPPPPPPRTIS